MGVVTFDKSIPVGVLTGIGIRGSIRTLAFDNLLGVLIDEGKLTSLLRLDAIAGCSVGDGRLPYTLD